MYWPDDGSGEVTDGSDRRTTKEMEEARDQGLCRVVVEKEINRKWKRNQQIRKKWEATRPRGVQEAVKIYNIAEVRKNKRKEKGE